jgi:hypothetical protein
MLLLDADLDLVVKAGFIYLPLLFDPAIEKEIHTPRKTDVLIEVNGRLFVRALSLRSFVENYEKIDKSACEQLRNTCLQGHGLALGEIAISETLRTILFHVMPRFIRRSKSLTRSKLTEEDLLDLIAEKTAIPAKYYDDATEFLDTDSLRRVLQQTERPGARTESRDDGLVSAHELREWLLKAVAARIVDTERGRLRHALHEREQFVKAQRKHLATLLYIAEKGSLEIDGFGFSRVGLADDYLIYRRTGEYALKDFFGRTYLFPDCRVAVSTIVPLKPVVLDTYKHPFLEGHDAGQPICLRGSSPPRVFTASNVINALQEGINALLYGYSSRRRNGYHSLDRTARYVGTIDPDDDITAEHEDYPVISTSRARPINFDDYRVSSDHPKIASGQVPVTNDYTP